MKKDHAWKALEYQQVRMKQMHLAEMFATDPQRFESFSLQFKDILVDFSKNHINKETLQQLLDLARACGLEKERDRLFAGEHVNSTEDRAAMHMALRHRSSRPVMVDGKDVMPEVRSVLVQMGEFCHAVHSGDWRGFTGKKIENVVSIGIGGSDLGSDMAIKSLQAYAVPGIKVHCVSNVDPSHLSRTLHDLTPETTLFIIISKTFTTLETMTNARHARLWLLGSGCAETDIMRHFVAVSTNTRAVVDFGIDPKNMFQFWDWVGGRYSMWSAVGLPIALSIGMSHFEEMLEGAYEMDLHFLETGFDKNIPVILALLGVWYINFWGASTHAVIVYSQQMYQFSAFLQQLVMESLGKSVTHDGKAVSYSTSPVTWGKPGTNSQHAFFQMIHQGTQIIPTDFLAPACNVDGTAEQQQQLISNFIAQTEALMKGKSQQIVEQELSMDGQSSCIISRLAPHKVFPGNKPTTAILFEKITPATLGSIVAMYEHKTFVQSVIWDINAFDQWGVELGKHLAEKVLDELGGSDKQLAHDSSTNGLIQYARSLAKKT
ncbi:MAG: glucose-6-phosphate isomerase [Nitrosomonas sp.]|nr:glucose-6-phosphate isomerase [Nitrosomonas sp.]